jgi:EAL domain-containing protein (putative c-di-GMP-specific phosphodiesterase class I)
MAIDYLRSGNEEDRTHSVAVNLSAQSVSDERFVTARIDRLRENDDIRSQLLFEITESQRIDDLATTNKAIQTMRSAGHQICLDDFGVGETSLQHLRQLQIDVVKIDGSYVREAFTSPPSRHILKAIVNLCQDLNVKTVAEMVEDEKTVDFLLDCGVNYGQGYLFGKPNNDIEVFQTPPAVERVLRGGGIVEVASS